MPDGGPHCVFAGVQGGSTCHTLTRPTVTADALLTGREPSPAHTGLASAGRARAQGRVPSECPGDTRRGSAEEPSLVAASS